HREVLLESRAEGQLHVPVVTLGDKGHDRRAGFAQCCDQGVVGRLHACPAGRAERGELRVPQVELCSSAPEELGVLGVGSRPASLDEADAQVVQVARDSELDRKSTRLNSSHVKSTCAVFCLKKKMKNLTLAFSVE